MRYVSDALSRIFNKYFNFEITSRHILDAFNELGYSITFRKAVWDVEKKEPVPAKTVTITDLHDVYACYDAYYINVNVEPYIVNQLRLVTSGLPPHTNKDRLIEKEEMIMRIEKFKHGIS